ncbi:hypothetical protein [Actinomadura sp. 9N407]|uniref:hypothetical protein n=1 Tax=Actinomadura sp. 9N407 TaxID=3375154 RepID=UPI003796C2A9
MADDLRARRPGAVGHVYNVYGPHLFEYADVLLGDRELAVECVRAALTTGSDDPGAVPGPDRFRGWLYALVRDECLGRLGVRPEEPVKHLATVGAATGLEQEAVTRALRHNVPIREFALMVSGPGRPDASVEFMTAAALEGSLERVVPTPVPPAPEPERPDAARPDAARSEPDADGHLGAPVVSAVGSAPTLASRSAGTNASRASGAVQRAGAVALGRLHRARLTVLAAGTAAAVVLTGLLVIAQSPDDGPPPAGIAAAPRTSAPPPAPSPSKSPEAEKTKKPEKKKPRKKARPAVAKRGRLAIGDSGCRGLGVAGLGGSCSVRLTARGGPVRWSVSSVDGRGVSASGGGSLAAGKSTTVTVTVRPSIGCYARGGGSGSVSFAPGGSASVSFTCWRR